MPGLFGFVQDMRLEDNKVLLHNMAVALQDQDWYQVDLFSGEGFGLGRASLGYLNPEPQPIWNEDGTLCVIMEGELYDYQPLKQDLQAKGYRFTIDNDAEFLLHLFEEYGKDFAVRLNGAFVAAICIPQKRELILVNDRLGLRPLYYCLDQSGFTFASGVRALLENPSLSREVDRTAIAQFVSFEYPLDDRTFLKKVKMLPPGTLLTCSELGIDIKQYWKIGFSKVYTLKEEGDYLEGLIYHMQKAVRRQAPGKLLAGINLSGGLDSRVLLGLLTKLENENTLKSFTFGIPGCDDVRFGKELADIAGIPHYFYNLKPDYLLSAAEYAVRLADGMESCIHVHAFANLSDQARQVRVLYTGYLIDSLISPDAVPNWFATYDDETVRKILFSDLNKDYLFQYSERNNLFTEIFLNEVRDSFDESFHKVLIDAKADTIVDWQNNLELHQRQRRFTENGNELMRSQVITRTPFCDNDLVEYILAIPPGLRFNQYIYLKAIVQEHHKLAKIPWAKTGYPLTDCVRDLRLRAENQFRWGVRNAGLSWIPVSQRRPYADYNHWLRTALKVWVEKVLLSEKTLDRGYFNPDYIRNLVAEHMLGKDHANRLGVLISLEIWHRQFLD